MSSLNNSLADWLVVVPARLASTRLPEKPLLDLGGKPLVVRVFENLNALVAAGAEVLVAVDDDRVAAVCRTHGVPFCMTRRNHPTGTDRVAEAAAWHDSAMGGSGTARPYVLNVQGDEPFIDPGALIRLCQAFAAQQVREKSLTGVAGVRPQTRMASMFFRSRDPVRFRASSCVKVVCAKSGHALYFSRSPIPMERDRPGAGDTPFLVHMGVYAFDREALEQFCQLPPSPLEQLEKLEQLRALEAGWKILMEESPAESLGIDTPADMEAARARYR